MITCSNAAQHSCKATAGGGAQRASNQHAAIHICQVMGPVQGTLGARREAERQEVPRPTTQRLDRGRSVAQFSSCLGLVGPARHMGSLWLSTAATESGVFDAVHDVSMREPAGTPSSSTPALCVVPALGRVVLR